MGGSSSNSFRYQSIDKQEVIRKIREADNETQQNEYELAISQLLELLLGQVNNRDTELIQRHLGNLIALLNDEIDGVITSKLGGSISKHTHLNGISDVDALVVLNNSELSKMKPNEVLTFFHKILTARLTKTEIDKGDRAITIHYSDGDVQLIPVLKYKHGIKIPDGKDWSTLVKPHFFSDNLTELNAKLNGRLIPAIKLVKGIISGFPERSQLKGYHIESIALQIYSQIDTSSPIKLKSLVTEFFKTAPGIVRKPIKDLTMQSSFVDEYLGKKDSLPRLMVADNLERTYRQIEMADTANVKEIWHDLFSHM